MGLFGRSWLDDIVRPATKILGPQNVFLGPGVSKVWRRSPRKCKVPYSKRTLLRALSENQEQKASWYLLHVFGFSCHQLINWGLLDSFLESERGLILEGTSESTMSPKFLDTPLLVDLKLRYVGLSWADQQQQIEEEKKYLRAPANIVIEATQLVRHFSRQESFTGWHHSGPLTGHQVYGQEEMDLAPRSLRIKSLGGGKFAYVALPYIADVPSADLGACVVWKPE